MGNSALECAPLACVRWKLAHCHWGNECGLSGFLPTLPPIQTIAYTSFALNAFFFGSNSQHH